MFEYLRDKYNAILVMNHEYMSKNNHASLYAVREYLKNTYICSADNYFSKNPFESRVSQSYYATVYAEGRTKEWCVYSNEDERIIDVQIGGQNAWYMLGHAFFDQDFSARFRGYLEKEYQYPETANMFWEEIYIKYIEMLDMKIRRYEDGIINEFDSLDELREFDTSYKQNTRSLIIEDIACQLGCEQREIVAIKPIKVLESVEGFEFICRDSKYQYIYVGKVLNTVGK